MRLLAYIDTLVELRLISKADLNDYKGIRKSVAQFIGTNKDIDILRLTQPQWIDSYYSFLVNHYRSNKQRDKDLTTEATASIADRYIKSLRKLVNHCIEQALLPDIDIFSGTTLAARFSRLRRVAPPSITNQLRLLVADKLSDDYTPYDVYLMSLYCAGMEVEDFMQLTAADFDADTSRIRLAHLNLWACYPESLFQYIYGYVADPTAKRFSRQAIVLAMHTAGRMLYAAQSIYTDFISFAIEAVGIANPRRLIMLRLAKNKCPKPDDAQQVQLIVDTLANRYNKYRKHWYAVKTFRATGQEVAEALLNPGGDPIQCFAGRSADMYVPHTAPATKSRNRLKIVDHSAVLRNMLFVHAYHNEIDTIARLLPDTSVLRNHADGNSEYARIPYQELYMLQLILRSLNSNEAQQIADDVPDEIATLPELQIGEAVTVSIPNFEGYQATVTRQRDADSYDVAIDTASCRIEIERVPRALINQSC